MTLTTTIIGKHAPPVGVAPAIVLENPKFAHNVGMTVRLASCYGIRQVFFTGERVRLEIESKKRIPREERMRGYRDVQMISYDRPIETFPSECIPVAVELRRNSERLDLFDHPPNAVYVFGPEDGSVSATTLSQCHRFVVIPTAHCLNLATAVATILYDRACKLGQFHGDGFLRTQREVMPEDGDLGGIFSDTRSDR